ncbi:MAG: cysteine desulfurase-like protein [Gemmatimonadetes bacterium]|nr:cysteine desulfurase-like protein [Gemmatimonadota bacterium]
MSPSESGTCASLDAPVTAVEDIRRLFPALEREHSGQRVAYFDGPGGTQVPRSVADAVTESLLHHNANRRWAYPSSAEVDATVAGARSAMGDFLGCGADDVVFGANMTALTYHLSRTLGRTWREDDEVVVTRLDHFANISPWRALEVERGVTVRDVGFHPASGTLNMDALAETITEQTRLVAVGWASNVLGTITDLGPVVRRAREVGALVFVDAVHSAPHVLPDVLKLGCDFLACSPYKFYGPHAGVMYAPAPLLDQLDVPRLPCAPQVAPERFETGTQSHEAMAGTTAAVDFLASLASGESRESRRARLVSAYDALHARGEILVDRLLKGLADLDNVTLYGPPAGHPRTPTVSFTVDGFDARAVSAHLSERHGVFVSHGNFYAAHVTEDLGVPGLVRAGCACYSTESEVDRLLDGLRDL